MPTFQTIRDQIVLLGRAEYQYDRLTIGFAEHYLELLNLQYPVLPDIDVFRTWLKHLHKEVRPALLAAWRDMAHHYGFALGDRIKTEGTDLYVVRISCYPLEQIVRFTGFAAKKDGKPGQSSATVAVKEHSVVEKRGQALDAGTMEPIFFEGTARQAQVKQFLQTEAERL